MPMSDPERIAQERLSPRIVDLWRALAPLKSVVSFMNTGAHPDDETSAMLAALGLRDGIDISYACSTRGEGGQNDIGTERGAALGALRTAEMERACDVLGLRMYWLSDTPKDTIVDFGFSKSGVETMEKWDRDRTLARFVEIVRTEKPDVMCPTFLDIPGQHGHHRAMTEAAHLVMDLAADPSFAGSDLPAWQVKKLYLPAWSGAGQAYDDDLPPPPATLTVAARGIDPVTGWSFERIGQQSRAFHKTQGMGRWVPAGAERDWPLHLARAFVVGPDDIISDGLPIDLRDLGLPEAQDHIDEARAAFPDFDTVLQMASAAYAALDETRVAPDMVHKVARKRTQLAHAIRIAAGAEVHGRLERDVLHPTDQTGVTLELRLGEAGGSTHLDLPEGWVQQENAVVLKDAALSDPYAPVYLPDAPAAPCIGLTLTTYGVTTTSRVALDVPPQVVPAASAAVTPLGDVINLSAERRDVAVTLDRVSDGAAGMIAPKGWDMERTETGFVLRAPEAPAPGVYEACVTLDGAPAATVTHMDYAHIAPRSLAQPAICRVAVIEAVMPDVRVGYIGGGADHVDHWLARMGARVDRVTDADLASDAALAQFDTIVVGIFALRFRPGLAQAMPRLHAWTHAGGTLVTLYHRPWDNWDPDATAPARLQIGQPSLRWRVTDETAEVAHLAEHPILSTPNAITPADWAGWHKERGLYFASDWDAAYTPLLEMADPNEAPHRGALLTAEIGAGRHTHCALILHHQMENLVPGAFRLMANLLAKRT